MPAYLDQFCNYRRIVPVWRSDATSAWVVAQDSAVILAGLTDNDPVLRRFAAGMAKHDAGPLSRAVQSMDATISQFAKDMLDRLELENSAAR
jgi:hypothetical protein